MIFFRNGLKRIIIPGNRLLALFSLFPFVRKIQQFQQLPGEDCDVIRGTFVVVTIGFGACVNQDSSSLLMSSSPLMNIGPFLHQSGPP